MNAEPYTTATIKKILERLINPIQAGAKALVKLESKLMDIDKFVHQPHDARQTRNEQILTLFTVTNDNLSHKAKIKFTLQ